MNLALEKITVEDFLEKGDYVRAKRKITSEIKHREKDIADQEQAEIDRIARQHEEENNIVAIDALIEGADEAKEEQVEVIKIRLLVAKAASDFRCDKNRRSTCCSTTIEKKLER